MSALSLRGLNANVSVGNQLGQRVELFKIDKITIKGLKKVEKEAVLEKMQMKIGDTVDNYSVKRDIERIYSMKYFDGVEIHHEVNEKKNELIIQVKEKPIITKITFDGNDGLSEEDLKGQVKTRLFSILDLNSVKNDVQSLLKHYEEKGYYLASVEQSTKKINDENVELVFSIKEFEKVKVKQVSFLGNKAFSDNELKSILSTQEDSLFSFMSGAGNFKEINFQTDIEKLKYFYRIKGYLQINIGAPEITVSEDKRWVFISLKINEGPQFSVNRIKYSGEILFTTDQLSEKTLLKEGETYSEEFMRKDIQALTEMYQDEGYAFANVIRNLEIVPGENKVDIDFSFEKGKMAYFGKFKIKGNSKSRDKVIRRELTIREGEKFNGTKLRVSRENVQRLGFFEPESVVFNTVSPADQEDIIDVEISVKEKNTGQLNLGAGYSTQSGMFFNASIAQNNFRGLGQVLSFSTNLGKLSNQFSVDFTEPYLNDTKWSLGGGIYVQENEASNSYKDKKKGFNLRLGYPIFENTTYLASYKLEDTQIKFAADPSLNLNVENGLASSIQNSIIYDKRDDRSDPRKGIYFNYSIEYTGLGGDKKWLKNEAEFRGFYPVWSDLIFRSRFYLGRLDEINGQDIPRTEKFSLGGSRNMRGYMYEAIGELATRQSTTNQLVTFNTGANFMTFTNLELQHPLSREAGLKWVIFFDAGHAGRLKNKIKIYSDYGFGFRWFSPLGVLRFEYGIPIVKPAVGDGGQFYFDIGQFF